MATSQSTNTARRRTSTRRTARQTRTTTTDSRNPVQRVAETAVDVPVGAVLRVADRVGELIEPWTSPRTAERELRSYRTQLTRSVNRAERRGATARRKATTQAKRTRSRFERGVRRVERVARKRQRKAETTLRQNRRRAQTTLRRNRRQAGTQLRKATRQAEMVQADLQRSVEDQSSRAQDFAGQVSDQINSLI
jgi:hypothetical protein